MARILTASFTGMPELKRRAAMLRAKFPAWLAAANEATAEEIKTEAQQNLRRNDTIASGDLYDSITVTVTARGMAIYVGSTSIYAPFVEFGTRPHFPPVEPIRQWCARRGLPETAAWGIAVMISRRGTPEQPFLYPALVKGQQSHVERMAELIVMGIRGQLS